MSFNKIRQMSGNICLVLFLTFLFSGFWGSTNVAQAGTNDVHGYLYGDVVKQSDDGYVLVGENEDGGTFTRPNDSEDGITTSFYLVITSQADFSNVFESMYAHIYDANDQLVADNVYLSNYVYQGVYNSDVSSLVYHMTFDFQYGQTIDDPTVSVYAYNNVLATVYFPDVLVNPPIEEESEPSGGGGGGGTTPPAETTPVEESVEETIVQLDEVLDNPEATVEEQTNALSEAVEKVGTYNVAAVTEGTTAKVTVDTASILAKADAVNTVEAAAEDSGITLNKKVEKKVSVSVEADADAQEVAAELPTEALNSMKQKGIDKVEVKTPFADIAIAPDAIDSTGSVSLSARQVNRDEIPASAGVPSGSAVVDLNATADGQKVSKFKKAVDVKVPYTLQPGDDPDTITVYLLKDDGTIQAVGGKYDPATGKVSFKTNHFSKYFAMPGIKEFADVEGITWAEKQIEVLAGKGFINGKSEGVFDPNAAITRAEFAALLTRLLALSGEVSSMPFTDVPSDAWYAEDVAAAFANGVVTGNSATTFDPNGNITRQEMAVMIGRVLSEQGYVAADTTELTAFTDSNAVAAWAKSGVAMAAREEIVNGNPDGSFAPAANASRAEAAVMLYRLFKK